MLRLHFQPARAQSAHGMGERGVNPSLDDGGYESVESMDSEDEYDDNQYGTMVSLLEMSSSSLPLCVDCSV